MATTASVYNASRTTRQVLKRHRKEGPSLTLHLYANTFRFERQNGAFLCESPLKNLLYFIRDQKVPADLVDIFDEARVPFFEGCLIIEVHDHRLPSSSSSSVNTTSLNATFPTTSTSTSSTIRANHHEVDSNSIFNPDSSARVLGGNYGFLRRLGVDAQQRGGDQSMASGSTSPNVYRIVLYPSAETLWTDLRMMNEAEGAGLWRDEDVLEIESRILTLTSPPLCLTPDLQVSRIANVMLSATAPPCAYSPSPNAPLPYFRQSDRKRGINSIEVELDESNKKRREKIMRMMEKGSSTKAKEAIVGSSTHAPSFARMAFVERWRASKAVNDNSTSMKLSDGVNGDTTAVSGTEEQRASSSTATATKKKIKKKKVAEDESQDTKETSPPAASTSKKKNKKKAQKEEKERAEREQAEREAAAAAAAKVKEEEESKKGKKGKKKDLASQAQAQAEAAEAEAEAASKKLAKKATKSKKAKIQPSQAATNSSISSDVQQQKGNLGTTPQQQTPLNMNMYQQQMLGYPVQGAQSGNLTSSYPGLFGGNANGGGIALPGQMNNYTPQQQALLQQAASQRILQQQQQQQQQQGMKGNFMMNPNQANQMQQHLQAFAAMQQQQQQNQTMATSQPSQPPGQFNPQDSLPVGVGLGNLPPNWNGMG